jgi:hypothetical protein
VSLSRNRRPAGSRALRDPEPWQPTTDPRLPGPRAQLVLRIDIVTEEPGEFAALR